MSTVNADRELPVYQVIGDKLRIHWDHQEVTVPAMDDDSEPTTQWQCQEAVVKKTANRAEIIEAIIATKYSLTEEIATINNGGAEYDEYQSFRQFAKDKADEWLSSTA